MGRTAKIENIETACGIEFHPHSSIFPLMQGEHFDALVADIEENGLRERITLLDGKVLDGRNRFRAMIKLDPKFSPETAPKLFTQFDGDDPMEWVVSKNLHRRYLNESQRAIIGARISLANPGKNRFDPGVSSVKIAGLMNVSPALVNDAKKIIRTDPEHVKSVMAGERRLGRRKIDGIIFAALPREEAVEFRNMCQRRGEPMAHVLIRMIRSELQRDAEAGRPITAPKDDGPRPGRPLGTARL